MASRPRLRIQERFRSIQGEGALVGTPSQFIRVSGCNLRCVWCDSPNSSWSPQGQWVALDDLVRDAADGPRHVVLTGGEPLLFDASVQLVRRLRAAGHHVTIETAGTVALEGLTCDLMSLSPKLAHSTPALAQTRLAIAHERARFSPATIRQLMSQALEVQFKYVVRAEHVELDLEEIHEQLAAIGAGGPLQEIDPSKVFLMPEGVDPDRLAGDYARLLPHCHANGFRLGQRLHIRLFGHTPGT